jgi:hypothetical protein
MKICYYSASLNFRNYFIFNSTSRIENKMLGYLFTSSPSCASLTGGIHIQPLRGKELILLYFNYLHNNSGELMGAE